MRLALVSFTSKGGELARWLAQRLEDAGHTAELTEAHGADGFSLREWTGRAFEAADGLVFLGAAGIAVRAVAPWLRGKAEDPAVVVADEQGRFSISLLSGHLGGANDLAGEIAGLLGAVPVITTATDGRKAFAVDSWAKRQGCRIVNPERVKEISARILEGRAVALRTLFPIAGKPPEGVRVCVDSNYDILLTIKTKGRLDTLRLVPLIAVVGVGCKRGTGAEALETAFRALLAKGNVYEQAVCAVCSLDRKADEPGLLEFCRRHNLPFRTFSPSELMEARGNFSSSAFVQSVTGVDNVCERSAVLGSGGKLYLKKHAGNGVTMAMALKPFAPDWKW